MIESFFTGINLYLWVFGNVLLAYSGLLMIVFVGAYFFFSNWRETPAGRSVLYFTASLLGLILLVVLGIYGSQTTPWYEYPPDIFWWRPILRVLIYLGISVTVTRLTHVLFKSWRDDDPQIIDLGRRSHPLKDRSDAAV